MCGSLQWRDYSKSVKLSNGAYCADSVRQLAICINLKSMAKMDSTIMETDGRLHIEAYSWIFTTSRHYSKFLDNKKKKLSIDYQSMDQSSHVANLRSHIIVSCIKGSQWDNIVDGWNIICLIIPDSTSQPRRRSARLTSPNQNVPNSVSSTFCQDNQ